ncbi:MAG: hypothetical protein L6R28_22565 [Planctomycetes bacterium]|nr:hypothetical protein [Planctomycetota bacterium]
MSTPVPQKDTSSLQRAARVRVAILAGAAILVVLFFAFWPRGAKPEVPGDEETVELDAPPEPPPAAAETAKAPPPVAAAVVDLGHDDAPAGKNRDAAALAYRWEAKSIYRFQIRKQTRLTPGGAEAAAEHDGRTTEFNGVLVVQVDTVDSDGTAHGSLRVDNSKFTLPPYLTFDSGTTQPKADEETLGAIAEALRIALAQASWPADIDAEGRIRVAARTPDELDKMLHPIRTSGKWNRKIVAKVGEILAKDLPFGKDQIDQDLLVALGEPAPQAAPENLAVLHPQRLAGAQALLPGGRLELQTKRVALTRPEGAKDPYLSHILIDGRRIIVAPGPTESKEGRAVFDLDLGLLDEFREEYRTSFTCSAGARTQAQTVHVVYTVKRLAPPLRQMAPPEE